MREGESNRFLDQVRGNFETINKNDDVLMSAVIRIYPPLSVAEQKPLNLFFATDNI